MVPGANVRSGGVPSLGGSCPKEADRAAVRADTPFPGSDACAVAPARGVILPGDCAGRPCAGICRTWGVLGVPGYSKVSIFRTV